MLRQHLKIYLSLLKLKRCSLPSHFLISWPGCPFTEHYLFEPKLWASSQNKKATLWLSNAVELYFWIRCHESERKNDSENMAHLLPCTQSQKISAQRTSETHCLDGRRQGTTALLMSSWLWKTPELSYPCQFVFIVASGSLNNIWQLSSRDLAHASSLPKADDLFEEIRGDIEIAFRGKEKAELKS